MSESAPALRCVDLTVAFGATVAVRDVSLSVRTGEVLALLGPSGSGKSTLLNTIVGAVPSAGGEIWLGGQLVQDAGRAVPPDRRPVGMVFQNYALWPHLTVLQTAAYPLRRAGHSRRQAETEAREVLRQLEIAHLAERRPAQLSGGEQQRAGLARALARHAVLYLLDEPTAHLDTHLRAAFTRTVLDRQRSTGAAVLYATHDAAEALSIADRVALMVDGRLVQVDTAQRIYDEPASPAAAALTGRFGTVPGVVHSVATDVVKVSIGDTAHGSGASGTGGTMIVGCAAPFEVARGRRVRLLLRPDWVTLGGPLSGRVTEVAFRGAHTEYRVGGAGGTVPLQLAGPPRLAPGDDISFTLERGVLLPAEPSIVAERAHQ